MALFRLNSFKKIHSSAINIFKHSFTNLTREKMEYDVVIVGGGISGLSAAIQMKKLDSDINVCVIEKGAEIGSHIISGNMFDPKAFNELFPDWKNLPKDELPPLDTIVTKEKLLFLTKNKHIPLPTPKMFKNHNNYIISLASLTRWMSFQAEKAGVEIYPGFSASEVLYDTSQDVPCVVGVATSDMGLDKQHKPKSTFERGIEIRGKYTVFAEGTRGSLSEEIIEKYDLRKNKDQITYGLGFKELWKTNKDNSYYKPGLTIHTTGFPFNKEHLHAHGGGFLYCEKDHNIHLGFVIGLDYRNPYMNLYKEFQKFKTHPYIKKFLDKGECISYGARCLNESGIQTIPKLFFPGGYLIGAAAGFMNFPRIKETHYAMKSGMNAAESIVENLQNKEKENSFIQNWLYKELNQVRNCQPSMKWKYLHYFNLPLLGLAYNGFTGFISHGKEPWTFYRNQPSDEQMTLSLKQVKKKIKNPEIKYEKSDGKLTFDLLANLINSGVNHEEDQPCHLTHRDTSANVGELVSLPEYGGIEELFCPANVYEYIDGKLQINGQNCIHCKTCDIKSIKNFIKWTVPEGSGGPNYSNM